MKRLCTCIVTALAVCLQAGVPCDWSAMPQRPAPAQFDRFHGESLDFRCTFTGFGALPFDGASDVRLWYQTNGMGAAWWSIPATVSSNVLAATFTPDRDPGVERLAVFFGAPSNAYASAQVRFRNSPGATPNELQPPSVLDWQAELTSATNEIPTTISNTVTKAYVESLRISSGLTTNDVCAIVTNEVAIEFSAWSYERADGNPYPVIVNSEAEYRQGRWIAYLDDERVEDYEAPSDALTLHLRGYYESDYYIATRSALATRNAIGLAKRSDITNIVNKAYVESLGIESGVSEATVTNVVRYIAYSINDYIWDGDVCWRRQILQGGYLEFEAVTNIDVTLPENYKALEALEKARRNQE